MKNKISILLVISILATICLGCSWLPSFIGDRGKHEPSFALSPDGKQMALSANDGDLYLIDLDGKKVTRLTETPAYEKKPSFSPDGRSLVFVSEPTGDRFSSRVFRMQIDSREIMQLTKDSGICDSNPHYSRDGARIVFARASRNNGDPYVRDLWNDYDLYVMNSDGSDLKQITNALHQRDLDGRFSADGVDLIYNATYFTGNSMLLSSKILEIKADGSDKNPATLVPSELKESKEGERYAIEYGSPDVSPDGNQILFIKDIRLTLLDLTSRTVREMPDKKPSNWNGSLANAVFSADGRRALWMRSNFNGENNIDRTLWSADIDGKNLTELADNQLFSSPLKWRPKN